MFHGREIDALYIRFDDVPADSRDYSVGVTTEVENFGRIIALEILNLHELFSAAQDALKASILARNSAA